jgi:hypothetical protein
MVVTLWPNIWYLATKWPCKFEYTNENSNIPKFDIFSAASFEYAVYSNLSATDHPLSNECLLDIFETSREVYSMLSNLRILLSSTHRLLLMTFGLMKASVLQGALRLLRSVLVLATVPLNTKKLIYDNWLFLDSWLSLETINCCV